MGPTKTSNTPYEGEIWEKKSGLRVKIRFVDPQNVTAMVIYIHDYSVRPGDDITIQLDEMTSDEWECRASNF